MREDQGGAGFQLVEPKDGLRDPGDEADSVLQASSAYSLQVPLLMAKVFDVQTQPLLRMPAMGKNVQCLFESQQRVSVDLPEPDEVGSFNISKPQAPGEPKAGDLIVVDEDPTVATGAGVYLQVSHRSADSSFEGGTAVLQFRKAAQSVAEQIGWRCLLLLVKTT